MIILIGNQKGGCGKSTIAVNICAYLAHNKHDVVLVDADRQCTAANWAADRSEVETAPVVHCVQKYENIRETLFDLDKRYEFVVVDAAGHDSRELRTGMTAADILLIPFRPSQPDLDTLPKVQEIIIQAKDLNPKLSVFGVITMGPTNPSIKETNEAQEYLLDYPEITLIKTVVGDRKVYRDCMSEGLGAVEMKNKKAIAEIQNLAAEVFIND